LVVGSNQNKVFTLSQRLLMTHKDYCSACV
jgi:hypothetical protein